VEHVAPYRRWVAELEIFQQPVLLPENLMGLQKLVFTLDYAPLKRIAEDSILLGSHLVSKKRQVLSDQV
jgi:hypothetical protein